MTKEITIEDLLGESEKPTRKTRGKSPATEVNEARFVAAYLKHGNATDAYLEMRPEVQETYAKKMGGKMLKRDGVRKELEARKDEARELAVESGLYDLERAHDELNDRIERASREGQHSAVASMMREKLKLHKLVDSKEAVAQAGFAITINSPDGETKVIGTSNE